jgi:hypothetical protein
MKKSMVLAPVNGTAPSRTPAHRPRQRITVFLPLPLIERLRNAVYWTEHRPLAQIIAEAIDDAVTEMEHANGSVFPQRLSALKPGRPRRSPTPASSSSSLHLPTEALAP